MTTFLTFSSHALRSRWPMMALGIAAVGAVAAALIAFDALGLVVAIAAALACLVLAAMVVRPVLGTYLFVGLLYMNAPVVAGQLGLPPVLAGLGMTGLACIPVGVYVFVQRRRFVLDYGMLLMALFLIVALWSSFISVDPLRGLQWIGTFLIEGVLIYVLVVNAIRNIETLRHAIWVLLCVSAFVCSLSIFQELTGSYGQQFYGLAQRNTEKGIAEGTGVGEQGMIRERERLHSSMRATGQIGEPNRFGQVLIVLFPLGVIFGLHAATRLQRFAALAATGFLVVGMFLTYSRGTFVNLVALVGLLVLLRYIRVRYLLSGALFVVVAGTIAVPGALKRITSIGGVESLYSESSTQEADGATRGRMTEMLAAFNVFIDHPIVGVGPSNYLTHYSVDYMAIPDISFRMINYPRRAHILYFELAAETGILGFVTFLALPVFLGYRLWQQRRYWLRRNASHAAIATGVLLGLVGYFGTAVFLHLSYQRYYWFLLGLAAATVQILASQRASEPAVD